MGVNWDSLIRGLGNPQTVTAKQDGLLKLKKMITPPTAQDVKSDEQYNYYHPEIKPGYSSGNKIEDMVYNHPWLMNLPVIGRAIKNKAYEVAKNSGGANVVTNVGETQDSYTGEGYKRSGPNLVDVYFGKQKLPESQYKPTSDYLEFLPSYSVKGDFNKKYEKGRDMSDFISSVVGQDNNGKPNPIDYSKPIYKRNIDSSNISEALGVDLGSHSTGVAYDSQRKLPYVSISDAWDFEPKNYEKRSPDHKQAAYVQASLMQQAGQPFKVYDRFYFDPKTNQYIPDDKLPPEATTPQHAAASMVGLPGALMDNYTKAPGLFDINKFKAVSNKPNK